MYSTYWICWSQLIFCLAFVCRVIPKTLMPREVMLRCFGSISLEMIKKKMTKHICKGTERELSACFPYLSTITIYALVPILWHPSEFPPYFCYPNIWASYTLVLFCDSCAVPSEWNYSQTSHILFIYKVYYLLSMNTYTWQSGVFPSEPFCPSLLVPYSHFRFLWHFNFKIGMIEEVREFCWWLFSILGLRRKRVIIWFPIEPTSLARL